MDRTKIIVYLEANKISTSIPDPRDKWDRANTSTIWTFERVALANKDSWNTGERETFTVPTSWLDKTVYIVWLTWSSGDSFGHDKCSDAQIINIYSSYEEALKVKNLILEDNQKHPEYGTEPLILPDGTKLRTNAWKGYFENLEQVYITDANLENYLKR